MNEKVKTTKVNDTNVKRYWEVENKQENKDIKLDLSDVDLKVSRVAQLDAELLDTELKEILSNKLFSGFSLFKLDVKLKYEPELILLLQSILFYFSFSGKFKASYGAMLQNLRFQNDFSKKNLTTTSISDPTLLQVSLYGAFTLGSQYFWSRWLNIGVGRGWGDEDSSNSWKNKVYKLVSSLEKWVKLINLVHYLYFIYNGRYRSIIERILGLRLVLVRSIGLKQLNFEYLNRQMVWDGFAEFLLFIAPLINLPKLTNKLRHILFKFGGSDQDGIYSKEVQKTLLGLPESTCAYCYYYKNLAPTTPNENIDPTMDDSLLDLQSNPNFIGSLDCKVQLPHSPDCGHLFCYQCISTLISTNPSSDSSPPCPRCHVPINNIQRHFNKIS